MSAPSYSQASLPALPAHLQSDTQLTAHLASRYFDRKHAFTFATMLTELTVFMSRFRPLVYRLKLWFA